MRAARLFFSLTLALSAFPVSAAPRFEVQGDVVASGRALEVVLRLRNVGDMLARELLVEGELAGHRVEHEIGSFAAGESRSLTLLFPKALPRPGTYALTLLIEFRPELPKDAAPTNQRAYLLLALGARPQPAVEIAVAETTLDLAATVAVFLRSADGAAHRVGFRAYSPLGVNVLEAPLEVEVPAMGSARAEVRVIRGGAQRGARHELMVVAGPVDGPLERTTVGVGTIRIAPDPAVLPRIRTALFLAGAALLVIAFGTEWRRREAAARSL